MLYILDLNIFELHNGMMMDNDHKWDVLGLANILRLATGSESQHNWDEQALYDGLDSTSESQLTKPGAQLFILGMNDKFMEARPCSIPIPDRVAYEMKELWKWRKQNQATNEQSG